MLGIFSISQLKYRYLQSAVKAWIFGGAWWRTIILGVGDDNIDGSDSSDSEEVPNFDVNMKFRDAS